MNLSLQGGGRLGSWLDDITTHNRLILFFTALSSIAIATSAYYTVKHGCRRR